MTTTLSEGVKVPDVGSVNWAGDLEVNWNLLNGALANLSGNVKLDRDNTWTGEQSFTLPIVGSITGTASKAIADEDGTSIKTGYGKLAGNQTWTGFNIYEQAIRIAKTSGDSEIEIVNKNIDITSNAATEMDDIRFMDKNGKITGGLRLTYTTDTGTKIELYARSWKADGTASYNRSLTIYTNGQTGEYYTTLETNFLPKTTGVYSLGTSSYQWSSVYAQTYYYNGTAWGLDKANVWSAWQTQEHATEPLIRLKRSNLQIGDPIPANQQVIGTIPFADKNTLNIGLISCRDNTNGDTYLTLIARQRYDSNGRANNGTQYESRIDVGVDSSKNLYLRPNSNNKIDLGTSTNKWKTLNGVNPGALSLPDFTSETGVSLSAGANTYTPVLSGWLSISTTGDISVVCGNFCHKATDMISVPVIAGKTYTVTMPASATGYFYPCLGNV